MNTLQTLLGEKPTSLKGEKKGLAPAETTMSVLTLEQFEQRYQSIYNALYEISDDKMIASYAAEVPSASPSPLAGFYITMETTYDTNCFVSSETMVGDHSTSTKQPGVVVTGYLTMSYNFASE